MPQCTLRKKINGNEVGGCMNFYPPDFVDKDEKTGKYICHFCKNGTDVLIGGGGTIYKRGEVIEDYRILVDRIAHSSKLQDAVKNAQVERAVKNIG